MAVVDLAETERWQRSLRPTTRGKLRTVRLHLNEPSSRSPLNYAFFTVKWSILHEMYTMSTTKVSLTPYDDKRYVLNDGVNTLAYGHAATFPVKIEEIDIDAECANCEYKIKIEEPMDFIQ